MATKDMTAWETAIAKVRSSPQEEAIEVRGHDLAALVGRVSFAEMVYLLIVGRRPTPAQGRVLDALLVASIEHGIAPPSMVARCFASYGTSLQAAIGGGVISFGDRMGGAGEALARAMHERVTAAAAAGPARDQAALDDAAIERIADAMVADARARNERLSGFGIPPHRRDPRSPLLLDVARREGVFATYCRLALALERRVVDRRGQTIPLNLDGVAAALILDLGIPWQAARLFIILPRTASMAAHYLEEAAQDSHWRHVPEAQIRYRRDGD